MPSAATGSSETRAAASSRGRRFGFRIAAVLLALGVVFVAAEIGIRIGSPQRTYTELETMVGSHYAASDFNPFTLRPNYSGIGLSMEHRGQKVTITTNSLGLRGKEVTLAKRPGTQRVIVLGDSYTFGVFVEDDETYSSVLEQQLRERGHEVEVLNAGYADGWDTDHQYSWLVNRGLDFEPDIVVVGFFTGNDIMNIRPKTWVGRDLLGLPIRIVDDFMFVDGLGRIRRTRTYDSEEIEDIVLPMTTVGDELIYRVPLLRQSHALILIETTIERRFRELGKATRGDARREWYPHIFLTQDDRFDVQEQWFLGLLRGMKVLGEEHDFRLMVLMIPFNFQVDTDFMRQVFPSMRRSIKRGEVEIKRNYFEDLRPKLDVMGIPSVDMLKLMTETPGRYYPKNGEVHWNPSGHVFTASALTRKLEELGWID